MTGHREDFYRRTAEQMLEFSEKLAAGAESFAGLPGDLLPGATDNEVVATIGGARLLHFLPRPPDTGLAPLLIVYALVNRHSVLDLEPDRSFIRGLLTAGRDVYLVDWGYPSAQDRDLGLDDYVDRFIDGFVGFLCRHHAVETVDLLGVCQGGTLALCYTALEPHRVRKLALVVTPVDFHVPEFLLSTWMRHVNVERMVAVLGNVPGSMLNQAFLALKPLSLSGLKSLDLIALLDRPQELATFVRMERWLQDSPDQAGRAFQEFVEGFIRDNGLVAGTLRVGERPVDLAAIRQPVLNLYATRDHIVPPASTRRLGALLPHAQYTEHAFSGGHVGVFTGRRGSAEVPGIVSSWLHHCYTDAGHAKDR